jgi:hypothetical protein
MCVCVRVGVFLVLFFRVFITMFFGTCVHVCTHACLRAGWCEFHYIPPYKGINEQAWFARLWTCIYTLGTHSNLQSHPPPLFIIELPVTQSRCLLQQRDSFTIYHKSFFHSISQYIMKFPFTVYIITLLYIVIIILINIHNSQAITLFQSRTGCWRYCYEVYCSGKDPILSLLPLLWDLFHCSIPQS